MEFNGQYLTYAEYTGLGGTLDQTSFKLLEFEARQIIDKYTFGRLKELDTQNQEVKLCVYKLIDLENSYNSFKAQNKGIASENTDGYSISYANTTNESLMAKNGDYKSVVRDYLIDCKLEDGTPYMYCGAK